MTANPGGALSGTAQLAFTFAQQADALLARNVSLYGQDTWRITPRFTLTYGLRWDLNPPLSYQWNVALEQSIGSSQSVSLTYVGAIGHRLLRVTQLANLNPNFPN